MRRSSAPPTQLATGPLAPLMSHVGWHPHPDAQLADTILAPDALATLLSRFRDTVHGPWPSCCSLWFQYYLNAVLIPGAALLAAGEGSGLDTASARVLFCPRSGLPLRLCLCDPVASTDGGTAPEALFAALLDPHLARLVGSLRRLSRLSERVFWDSVAHKLAWTFAQFENDQASMERIGRIPAAENRTAAVNALSVARQNLGIGRTDPPARRRTCCLRYQIDGLSLCAGLCPREGSRLPRPSQ